MQGVKALVPSFGNWDTAPAIAYTTVFETVRAEKLVNPEHSKSSCKPSQLSNDQERKLPMVHPHIDWKLNNMSSTLVDLYPSPKECINDEYKDNDSEYFSTRRALNNLERIADGIFFESQNAAENQPPTVLSRSMSSGTSWHAKPYGSIDRREHYWRDSHLKVFGKRRNSCVQLTGRTSNVRSEPLYASPKRPTQKSVLSAGSHSTHSMATPHLHHLPVPGRSLSAEMHQNRALPKFGDWDAIGLEFTVIFDQACNEKKSTSGFQESPSKQVTARVEEEDLYKPKIAPRRQSGIWTLLCCSNNSF